MPPRPTTAPSTPSRHPATLSATSIPAHQSLPRPRTSSSTKKPRLTPSELDALRKKYNKLSAGTDQYLYGVKLDPSVSSTAFDDANNSLPSTPTRLGIPGATSGKHPRPGPGRPSSAANSHSATANSHSATGPIGPIPSLPKPSSSEVLTMMKTLLLRGGIEAPSTPNPNSDPTAHKTGSSVTLYDDQRLALEKLKVKGGDKAAKKNLPKFLASKNILASKSLDPNAWQSHLPSYARRSPTKPSQNPLTPAASMNYEEGPKSTALETRQKAIREVLDHITDEGTKGAKLMGDSCMEPAVQKTRCALCLMFFHKSSTVGCISMKSVMELQSSWGVTHKSAKYRAASFIYKQASLCAFCDQLFSTKSRNARKFGLSQKVDDKTSGVQASILHNIKLKSLTDANDLTEIMDRNLAVVGVASQSSTLDGKLPTLAISGRLGVATSDLCTRTRREFESWWEVTLDASYPIKSIVVYNRTHGENGTGSYKLPPFWIFLTSEAQGTNRLAECKRKAICAACVYSNDDKIVWKLPTNVMAKNVRIQVEGVKSLQLAQVEIVKGGLVVAAAPEEELVETYPRKSALNSPLNRDVLMSPSSKLRRLLAFNSPGSKPARSSPPKFFSPAGGSSNMVTSTTFAFDFIGRPKLSQTSLSSNGSKNNKGARPSTAPDHSHSTKSLSSPITNRLSRPSTSHQQRKEAPPVSSLLDNISSAYASWHNDDSKIGDILSGFTLVEVDALKRNFLHFAEVDHGQVPLNTGESADYESHMDDLIHLHRLDIGQCAQAVAALKGAGSTGPKSRFKEVFGSWEKDEDHSSWAADDSEGHSTNASSSYIALVESLSVDELDSALRDVAYAREQRQLGRVSVTWYEYVHIIQSCLVRNLQLLKGLFGLPSEAIRRPSGDGGSNDDNVAANATHQHQHGGFGQDSTFNPNSSSSFDSNHNNKSGGGTKDNKGNNNSKNNNSSKNNKKSKNNNNEQELHHPCLSLSQSLKFYDNPSATYSKSPAPLRKPKAKHKGKSKEERREEDYHDLVTKLDNFAEPNLTGYEFVEEQDRRRERMNELLKQAKTPEVSPNLNRRNCSLCLLSFPMDAIISSVTVKNLKSLSKKWKTPFQKFSDGVSDSSLLMQHRIPVCAFCSQFFDPDSLSGLTSYKRKKRVHYVAFFDDAYPRVFNKAVMPDMEKEYVVAAKKRSMVKVQAFEDKRKSVSFNDGNEQVVDDSIRVSEAKAFEEKKKGVLSSYEHEQIVDDSIRVSKAKAFSARNTFESHGRAIDDWSEAIEGRAEALQHYNSLAVTLRAASESHLSIDVESGSLESGSVESGSLDEGSAASYESIAARHLLVHLDTGMTKEEIASVDESSAARHLLVHLDTGHTKEEMAIEDAKYMNEHTSKLEDRGLKKAGKQPRGTVRDKNGKERKIASTGTSIYEFSAQQEKDRVTNLIAGNNVKEQRVSFENVESTNERE